MCGWGGGGATAADSKYGYDEGELVLDVFTVPSSYGYNDWGTYPPTGDSMQQRGLGGDIPPLAFNSREVRTSQVKSASDMIAIADGTTDRVWDWNLDPLNFTEWPGRIHGGKGTKRYLPNEAHPTLGANVLFCDGHVEFHSQRALTTLLTGGRPSEMARRWNNNNLP